METPEFRVVRTEQVGDQTFVIGHYAKTALIEDLFTMVAKGEYRHPTVEDAEVFAKAFPGKTTRDNLSVYTLFRFEDGGKYIHVSFGKVKVNEPAEDGNSQWLSKDDLVLLLRS